MTHYKPLAERIERGEVIILDGAIAMHAAAGDGPSNLPHRLGGNCAQYPPSDDPR
jgi:hypothetical protein